MMNYTKGPWRYCGDDRGGCKCLQVWCEDHPICTVESGEWGDTYPAIRVESGIGGKAEAYIERTAYGSIAEESAKANAYLIAAAPDLLEACQAALITLQASAEASHLLEGFGPRKETQEDRLLAQVRAAIAKAQGAAAKEERGL